MPDALRPSTEFPAARPSPGQASQDAFVELHGGAGARTLYRSVLAICAACGWAGQAAALAARRPERLRHGLGPKHRGLT